LQEQTLGEVETRTVIWWPVAFEIFVPKTNKLWSSVFKLQLIMLGILYRDTV